MKFRLVGSSLCLLIATGKAVCLQALQASAVVGNIRISGSVSGGILGASTFAECVDVIPIGPATLLASTFAVYVHRTGAVLHFRFFRHGAKFIVGRASQPESDALRAI